VSIIGTTSKELEDMLRPAGLPGAACLRVLCWSFR